MRLRVGMVEAGDDSTTRQGCAPNFRPEASANPLALVASICLDGSLMLRLGLFLLVALSLPLRADPAADALVQKMVARDKVLVQHRRAYTYTVVETREKLDADGKTNSTSQVTMEIRGDKSPDYGTRSGQGMEASLKQAAREEPFNILDIISHYQFTRVPDEMWNGVLCYKIHFTPKENQPYNNREEKVANELAGDLWIDQADYSLLHNTGHLTQSVSVAWFFAAVHELNFDFDTMRLPNGDFGPSRIQYSFRVKIPFTQIYERHTRVMSDYRLTP
jgi:hypothetical protein